MIFTIFGTDFLNSCFFNLILFFGALGYLAVNCGVCDTSITPEITDSYGCSHKQPKSPSESTGFDINPALSPVFEKGATERTFDVTVFEETKEEFNWWNVKIICSGSSNSSI